MSCPDPGLSAIAANTIAAAIAEGQDDDELEVLAALFTMVGDTIAYIALQRKRCRALSKKDPNTQPNHKMYDSIRN